MHVQAELYSKSTQVRSWRGLSRRVYYPDGMSPKLSLGLLADIHARRYGCRRSHGAWFVNGLVGRAFLVLADRGQLELEVLGDREGLCFLPGV
jgi:hypothetical protein